MPQFLGHHPFECLEMIATEGNLWRWDSDTVTAFLQGEFQHGEKGQLFCMPPFHMTELDPDGRPYLWSLNKAVHGTRQAASAHVDTMEQWLFQRGAPTVECDAGGLQSMPI